MSITGHPHEAGKLPSMSVPSAISLEIPESSRVQESDYSLQLEHLPLQLPHLLETAVPRIAQHDVVHEVDAHYDGVALGLQLGGYLCETSCNDSDSSPR
jgi:hypothetical protein